MIRLFGRGLAVLLLASSFSVMAQDAVTGEPDSLLENLRVVS